tara:strand:- start:851 stop:1783 length:933 start_codon:yes stop_codon:yes gene_type:complete
LQRNKMNKFESLDKTIQTTLEEYDSEIIEIKSLKQLYEISAAGGAGGLEGFAGRKNDEKEENILRRENKMISRKDMVTEKLVREYIRKKIKENMIQPNRELFLKEQALRKVIRKLIKEGDISDIHPHRSTGINMLEDVLKKAIPTLRMDYKRLTTDEKQRKSFRAHIINAVLDSLKPMEANDQYLQGSAEGASSPLMAEPTLSEEEKELDEAEIDVDITGDEDKKIPVEDDDTPSDEEQFGTGLEGEDETGRNMAFTSYKKVSQYILDAYDSLANPKDKKTFTEYLVINLKLYFDKFEDELQSNVQEPEK